MLKQLSDKEILLELEASLPPLLSKEKRKEYGITKKQEQNLRKLYVGLQRLFPTHESLFEMDNYHAEGCKEEAQNATMEHPCGTAACAAGYGPSCGIPFRERDLGNFIYYTDNNFGGEGLHPHISVADFIFSEVWTNKPNQMAEAIARIGLVLAGKSPKAFTFDDTYA